MYLDLNLSALPIFFALWTLIGWLLCYVVAVLTGNYCSVPRQSSSHYVSGHIDPLLPLISMCGAQWPESSLFSLFMNMSAVMSAFLSYFRFRQVNYSYRIIVAENLILMFQINIFNHCGESGQLIGLIKI